MSINKTLANRIRQDLKTTDFSQPVVVAVEVYFHETPKEKEVESICIFPDTEVAQTMVPDDQIFYYVKDVEELIKLTDKESGEDFVVCDYFG